MNKASILHHFYSLLQEMNYSSLEEDLLNTDSAVDPFIQKHLLAIRLRTARNKADYKKQTFHVLMSEINRLRQIGVDELKKIITPSEALQLQPLFSKFESLTKKDTQSIADDEEILQLLTILKNKIDKGEFDVKSDE